MPEIARLLLVAAALVPLAACAALLLVRWRWLRARAGGLAAGAAGLAFCCAATVCLLSLAGRVTLPVDIDFFRWAALPGPVPLEIRFGVQADPLVLAFLVATFLTTALILLHAGRQGSEVSVSPSFFAAVLALQFAAAMLFLADGFLQLLFWWEAAGLALWHLSHFRSARATSVGAARKLMLIGRIADIGFIMAVLLIWLSFGTLHFSAVFDPLRIAELVDRNPAMPGVIGLGLFAGVVGRCAQFPLFTWLQDAPLRPTVVNALVHGGLLMPAGVYVMLRAAPFFADAPTVCLLIGLAGAMTALLTAAVAAGQDPVERVCAFGSAHSYGLIFAALGAGLMLSLPLVIWSLAAHLLGVSLLFLTADEFSLDTADSESRHWRNRQGNSHWLTFGFVAGALVLCGLPLEWIGAGPLTALWNAAESSATGSESLYGSDTAGMAELVFWIAVLSQGVLVFALTRQFFTTVRGSDGTSQRGGSPSCSGQYRTAAAVLTAGLLLLLAIPAAMQLSPSVRANVSELNGWTALLPTAVSPNAFVAVVQCIFLPLGGVIAWMLFAVPSARPERLARTFGPFVRLSRNRFYLDEMYFLGVNVPTRAVGQLCRFFEWFLIDAVLFGSLVRLPLLAARALRPLQNGLVQFYALAMTLAATVLILVLLFLQG